MLLFKYLSDINLNFNNILDKIYSTFKNYIKANYIQIYLFLNLIINYKNRLVDKLI